MKVSMVLLLAGRGKRFGSNKLLAEFGGRPLYQIAIGQALASGADHVTLVSSYDEILDYCRQLGLEKEDIFLIDRQKEFVPAINAIKNHHSERGISESIRLGLKAELASLKEGEEISGCCFLTGDQPLIKDHSLQRLFTDFRAHPDKICMLSDGDHFGNPAIFPMSLFGDLMSLSGDSGGKKLAMQHPDLIRLVMAGDKELSDIDCKEDLIILQREFL